MEKEQQMFISDITRDLDISDYANLNLLFETLDATSRLTNASMFVIDFYKKELIYRTETLIYADESNPEDKQRECTNPYWALIKESHLDRMVGARNAYLSLMQNFTKEEKLHHTSVIDYNIFIKNREYTITQKFTPLKLSHDGTLWLGLFYITASPHKTCEHIVVLGENFIYTYDFRDSEFHFIDNKIVLTPTEKAILLHAHKGMSTTEISDKLCKSVDTIKTHKKRLFKKLHASSMSEALLFASNYNLF